LLIDRFIGASSQKEYEALESRKAYRQELDQINGLLVKAKKGLADAEMRLEEERERSLCAQRQADRLQSQLQDRDDYISRLPTMDEVARTKQQVRAADLTVSWSCPQLFAFSDGRGQRGARDAQGAD